MQLSTLQLEIQKLGADKELKFGCIIYTGHKYESYIGKSNTLAFHYSWSYRDVISNLEKYYFNKITIIGKPVDHGRLCYRFHKTKNLTRKFEKIKQIDDSMYNIDIYMIQNPELYNQTILERPSELVNLVRDFILSIQSDVTA